MTAFYALVVICALAEPTCDVEHAVYASQSAPIFDTEDECKDAAMAHVAHRQIPALVPGQEYQIEITCESTGSPA
jgi:hypothetical protein